MKSTNGKHTFQVLLKDEQRNLEAHFTCYESAIGKHTFTALLKDEKRDWEIHLMHN